MTSREKPFFVFSGPPRHEFVSITNETLAAFNESRSLLDYGIADDLAKGIAEATESIGQFLESCHQEIVSRQDRLITAAAHVKHKRIHLWMVFCSYEEDLRRNYDIVRSLTVGGKQLAQVSRILAGDSKEVREWQTKAAEFAQVAAYLDLRIMYLPMRTAVALVTAYGPQDLMTTLKEQKSLKRGTVRVRAQESLANTAIGAFLQKKEFFDDPSRRGKPDDRQKEIFQALMKTTANHEKTLNATIAYTLRDWLNNPEIIVATETDLNENRALLGDITVVDATDIFCIEMKWRSSILHDAEVIRESVERVTDFAKNLPELKHLLAPM